MGDYTKKKYTIKKNDFVLMIEATDKWLDKYKKAPFAVYLRKEGKKVENYISYEKYQELKTVFEKEKGIDMEIVYKPMEKK